MKFDRICRACLLEKANLRPLFDACVANMLMSCASVQVLEGDGLPNQICTQCVQSVNRAYTFKQLCEKSDMTLRNYLSMTIPSDNILHDVKSDLFSTSEVLQQSSLFQDIFNDATTHSLVETFTHQNASTVVSDLAETMQSLQTIAEQCLPESWESDGNIVPCSSEEATDNFDLGSIYKCQFCQSILKDDWSLAEHIKNHTEEPKFYADMCNKVCSPSTDLEKQLITHAFVENEPKMKQNKEDHICNVCEQHFNEARYLKKHLREVHFIDTGTLAEAEKKYGCNICGKRYRQNKLLVIHMRNHTGERPLSCEICGRTFALPSSLHKHRNIHNAEKKFGCTICNKKFNQSSNLNEHLRTHTGQKSHTCSVCGNSFSTNTNLEVHMRIHTGIRPFSCDFCEMSFNTAGQLKKHRMIHTGEKPYPCWQCGRSFRRKETRDTHVRYHTGERPYSCDVCSKKYVAANHLRDHMKTHNNTRKFECIICLKKFYDSKVLKIHILSHTGQKPYPCRFCGKQFSQSGAVFTHTKNCHAEQTNTA